MLAWLVHRLRHILARLMVRLNGSPRAWRLPPQLNRLAQATGWPDESHPRQVKTDREKTLRELVANTISWLAFTTAAIAGLHQFANADTIVWVFGLFGTAMGFAARTFIGDLLAGLSIIFQDRFAVGEKVLVKAQLEKFEGVVEHVTLSATWLRATTGERNRGKLSAKPGRWGNTPS